MQQRGEFIAEKLKIIIQSKVTISTVVLILLQVLQCLVQFKWFQKCMEYIFVASMLRLLSYTLSTQIMQSPYIRRSRSKEHHQLTPAKKDLGGQFKRAGEMSKK